MRGACSASATAASVEVPASTWAARCADLEAGRITKAQRDVMVADLSEEIDRPGAGRASALTVAGPDMTPGPARSAAAPAVRRSRPRL